MLKDSFLRLIRFLEHNEHYTTIHVFGEPVRACSRCLGMYSAMLIALPIVFVLSLLFSFGFWTIFLLSWFLTGITIIDWATTKLHLWDGNNTVRIATGAFLGISSLIYLFLLPVPWYLRIGSLWCYGFLFAIVHYGVKCKEFNLSIFADPRKNIAIMSVPLMQTGAGCTGGCCEFCGICPCGNLSACLCSPCCCCVAVCPILLLLKGRLDTPSRPSSEPAGGA